MNLEFEHSPYEFRDGGMTCYIGDRDSHDLCVHCNLDERETMKDPTLRWDRYRMMECRHVMHSRCARDCWNKHKAMCCPLCGLSIPLLKRSYEEAFFNLSLQLEDFNIPCTSGKRITDSEPNSSLLKDALRLFDSNPSSIALEHTKSYAFSELDEDTFSTILYYYRNNRFVILEENVFKVTLTENREASEGKIEDKTYYLAVVQKLTKMYLKNQALCPLSLCCNIKVKGKGFLFKTREDVDKASYYLLGYRQNYRASIK